MKLYIAGFLALLSKTNAAPSYLQTCSDQAECITFTTGTPTDSSDGNSCSAYGSGACLVQVCMDINTSRSDCAKAGGETISHACDASDANGCPTGGAGTLTFDTAGGPSCNGQVLGTDQNSLSGKCEGITDTTFCQWVPAGEKAYFIIKDSQETEADELETYYTDTVPITGAGTVECFRGNGDRASDDYPLIIANDKDFDQKFSCGGGANLERTSRVWVVQTEGECQPNDPTPPPQDPEDPTPPPQDPEDPVPTPTKTVGDPHFLTWKKEHFEFHGQCDITLAKDDDFADGLGLNVQIRTQVVRHWSYNRNIAVMIGDDILEVEGGADSATWWFNLERLGKLTKIGDGKFPLTHHVQSPFKQSFEIDLSSKYPGHKIVVSTYKEFVRVDFQGDSEAAYGKTVGILGDYKTGQTLARDGSTVLDDFMELGEEWQVLPSENMLFHEAAAPQFPEKCIRPDDPRGERRRRRLGEVSVTEDQAEAACAHLKNALDRKDCVYDVLATQDVDMVGAY